MEGTHFDATRICAYFLWEYTQFDSAMSHWFCVEDIACFFEERGIFDLVALDYYIDRNKHDVVYINFIRNLAYRIFVFTGNNDSFKNWMIAERLVNNMEWNESITGIAKTFNLRKSQSEFVQGLRLTKVKDYYTSFIK